MNEALRIFLRKTFDIREGEGLRALLMQLNIFLIITTLLIVKPTVNGLFLSQVGVEALPLAYVLVAVFAAFFSYVYARFLSKKSLYVILQSTLICSFLLFVFFGLILKLNIKADWILYAFYVWVSIFAVLTASQFWILANVVFNIREAKRLFGFIGAGAIAGGIFGGYLTNLLAGHVGSINLIFIGSGFLIFCLPITRYIWNHNVLAHQNIFQREKKIEVVDRPLHLILHNRHLSYLAGIVGVSVLVAKLVDYQFSAVASMTFSDQDELTAFFGFWFSTFNVISLAIQLLLTRRVVGTMGVGFSLLYLPGSILIGAILLFFAPVLWAAIIIKLCDGSLKQSINKAAVELLALPIPVEIKNQTKTFIDVVVDSVATGISGLILIFVVRAFNLSIAAISLIIVMMIGVWIYFVVKVRKEYLASFRLKVEKANTESALSTLPLKVKSIHTGWEKVLETGSELQILFTLRKIYERPESRYGSAVIRLLDHPSEKIRAAAVSTLTTLKKVKALEKVRPLINDPSPQVAINAFDYLIANTHVTSSNLLGAYLQNTEYKVKLAALVSMAKESRDNPKLRRIFKVEEKIGKQLKKMKALQNPEEQRFYKIALLQAIGHSGISQFFTEVESMMEDESKSVVRQAILSAGDTLHPHFVPSLIWLLGHSNYREVAINALVKYGREIVKVLYDYAQSENYDVAVVQAIPGVMEKLGTQLSADLLFQLLTHSDMGVRLSALRGLNHLRKHHSHLKFNKSVLWEHILQEAKLFQDILSILYVQMNSPDYTDAANETRGVRIARQKLVRQLERRMDRNLERIFRLLGLKYPPDDVLSILHSIQSKRSDLRMNAMEFLDNLLDPGLKKILIPLVETAMLESITERALSQLNVKIPEELECYRILLAKRDTPLKVFVLKLLNELNDPKYTELARECINHNHPVVMQLAKEIVERGNN